MKANGLDVGLSVSLLADHPAEKAFCEDHLIACSIIAQRSIAVPVQKPDAHRGEQAKGRDTQRENQVTGVEGERS